MVIATNVLHALQISLPGTYYIHIQHIFQRPYGEGHFSANRCGFMISTTVSLHRWAGERQTHGQNLMSID